MGCAGGHSGRAVALRHQVSMREPLFNTRITGLLGIAHPILCGGLGPGVSDARYVAAVVNAGGMGFIMALGWSDPEEFRAELRGRRPTT